MDLAWLGEAVFMLVILLLLLFPYGHFLTRRWRWVGAAAMSTAVVLAVAVAFDPGPLYTFEEFSNPLGIEAAGGALEAVRSVASVAISGFLIAAGISLVVRYRRAGAIEREQIKWFAAGAALAVVLVAIFSTLELTVETDRGLGEVVTSVLALLSLSVIPVAAGIAILRSRLYDIDVVIRRTVIYGALTASLAGAYLGIVLLLQLVLSPRVGPRDRRLHAGRGSAVPATARAHPRACRPALLPQPLRRRRHARRVRHAAARRGGARVGQHRSARRGGPDHAARTRVVVAAGGTAVSPTLARRLAFALWALAVVLVIPGPVLTTIVDASGGDVPYLIAFVAVQLAAATTGAVVASRLPKHPIGWIFLGMGAGLALAFAANSWAEVGLGTDSGPLPGDELAAWLGSWLFIPAVFGPLLFLLLLFPTGRLLSPRWKWPARVLFGLLALALVGLAFAPGEVGPEGEQVPNPLAAPGAQGDAMELLDQVTNALAPLGFGLALTAIVLRVPPLARRGTPAAQAVHVRRRRRRDRPGGVDRCTRARCGRILPGGHGRAGGSPGGGGSGDPALPAL